MGQTTLGLLRPFHHGRGYRSLVVPANPSAGATYTKTVPGDKWQRLTAIAFTLATSNVAANRAVTIDYANKAKGHFLSDGAAVIQAASTTNTYYGSSERANSEWNAGTAAFFPLWGGFLESGETITISVANIDTGDQLSGIVLTVEEFEVGHGGFIVGGISTEEYDLPDDVVPG